MGFRCTGGRASSVQAVQPTPATTQKDRTMSTLILVSSTDELPPHSDDPISSGDRWRLDDVKAAGHDKRKFLAQHHLFRIIENIRAERTYPWSWLMRWIAEAQATASVSEIKLPDIGGRSVIRYTHNNVCMFQALERIVPEADALRRCWRPEAANLLRQAVVAYKDRIQAIQAQTPTSPPSSKRAHIDLIAGIVPMVIDALADLEQELKAIATDLPCNEWFELRT
jgi:hypothetical protein